jgi:hypothetical protein
MWYLYKSHLSGDLYVSSFKEDYESLYCEQCGDSDYLFDTFDTEKEAEEYAEKYNNGEIEID